MYRTSSIDSLHAETMDLITLKVGECTNLVIDGHLHTCM